MPFANDGLIAVILLKRIVNECVVWAVRYAKFLPLCRYDNFFNISLKFS